MTRPPVGFFDAQRLVDFLLARIAEDEARAPEAHYAPFEREWEWCPVALSEAKAADPSLAVGDLLEWGTDCTCDMPAYRRKYLTECEAKRLVIKRAMFFRETGEDAWRSVDDFGTAVHVGDDVLRALSLPYAEHPGYQSEWRP